MPFLDNLILGRPGGERRRRHTEDLGHAGGAGGNAKRGPLLSTLQTLQRRSAGQQGVSQAGHETGHETGHEMGRGPGEVKRRRCGNAACGRSWTLPWKSREHPVFDGHWACSRACLSAMVKTALTRETGDGVYADGPIPHHHRVPLGLLMLAQGWITHPELQRALEAQRTHGSGRIGEWLVSECGLKSERVVRGLGAQWNCPVLSTEGSWPEAMALALPRVFLEEYGVVPLRVAGKKILYVGFQDSLDASASFALERMTGLRAESGVLPEGEFGRARETLLRCEFPRQSIAATGDRDGLARAIAETVEHEQPEASRLVRLHRYYWLRVWAKGEQERAVGDLPSNANGVRDYLFTIGRRVAYPVQEERRKRPDIAAQGSEVAVPAEVVTAGIDLDEMRATPEEELPVETAVTELERPAEHGAAVADADPRVDLKAGAAGEAEVLAEAIVEVEANPSNEAEAYLKPDTAVPERVSITDGPWARHYLAKRESWFDSDAVEDDAYVSAGTSFREESVDLQRFMRRGIDSEMETIDGEYLSGEYLPEDDQPCGVTATGSSALVTEVRPSNRYRLGLLKRLTPSFLDRENVPGPGPGQEG